MTILINVINQELRLATPFKTLVNGTQEFIKFKFVLDDAWLKITTFAQFVQDGTAYNVYLDDNKCVFLPREINNGTFTLMLYGTGEHVIGTSNYLTLKMVDNIFVGDAQSTEITESLYTQLVNRVNTLDNTIKGKTQTDKTLTQSDVPADAKATGDKINHLKESVHIATVNIAGMVDGELTSENIAEAIGLALTQSSYIYIPSGEYSFNVNIMDDCTIYMDEQCFISSATADPVIHAQNCSINIIGGNILNGEDDDSRVAIANKRGLIFLEGCHDSSIVGVNSPYSKANSVIWIKDCENFILEQSTFSNMLRAAMFICGHCVNVTVRNCKFTNSVPLSGQDYCYFVYTGSMLLTDNFEPVDGLVYESNYCSGSEDCALDTHGARNVIIRNNTVLDTVCAITAYNDNKRVTRPAGWKMENILIENNYCDSTRQNAQGRSYPHPFLFIGASNNETALYDEFRNCIVRNNVFRTANNFEYGAIFNDVVSRNLIYENNTFKFYEGAVSPITFRRSFGSAFKNNRLEDGSASIYFRQFFGEVSGNVGFRYDWSPDFVSYVKGLNNIFPEIIAPTHRTGDVFWSNGLKICTSYGICARVQYADDIKTFNVTVANGIATVENNVYIPHLALTLSGVGSAYIKDVIDATRFLIVDRNKTPIADGSYTATIKDVTMDDSVSSEVIATAVSTYLDEHLTNPTNPPIDTSLTIVGAAADAKKTGDAINELKSELSGCQIINSIGEMNTVTSDKVLVLHNNSPWGNGGSCWFEYLDYATEGGYARKDGGKMYPMLDQGSLIASTPPVETIMSLISSYVENDSLIYGNDHTLFESETTNEIDCSAFVSAILHGIAYSFSKYTGSSVNRRAEKISSYSPTPLSSSLNPPLQRLKTRYMAQYFAEQGWLHKMPSYLNMRDVLQFGDILFSWDDTEVAKNRFLKIGHVSIVLAVLDSTQIVVAQCGNYPSEVTVQSNSQTVGKISTINLNNTNITKYFSAFARIPYTAQINVNCVGSKIKPVFIPNTYIDDGRNGVESISGICATSYGYIKVNPESTLTFTGSSEHRGYELIAMVAEYDKNLQFISKTRFTSAPKTMSANTRYIKLCYAHSSTGDRPPMLLEDCDQFEATIS